MRGAAVVELAICLPVLLLLIFGSIQACNLIHVRQKATTAAYEGALVGLKKGTTESEVTSRVQAILSSRKLKNGTTTVSAAAGPFSDIRPGDLFTVTVTVPADENIIGPSMFMTPENVEVSLTAARQ